MNQLQVMVMEHIKINCRFTLLAKFRLWRLRLGCPKKMIPGLSFSTYPSLDNQCILPDKDKIDQIGNAIASANNITERIKIGLKYGFRLNMAGLNDKDESRPDHFLCESLDGVRFTAGDKEMIQYLAGKKVSLAKDYSIKVTPLR